MLTEKWEFSLLKLTIVALVIALHITSANAAVGDVLISDASKTLSVGELWYLEEGYTLTLLDIDGTKAWVELYKNGNFVADSIMDLSYPNWVYEQDIGGELDVVIIRVTLSAIPTANTATFSSLYQYSDGTTQTTGSIAIWSDSLYSNIYLDGTYYGQTGSDWVWLDDVSVGTHTVKITKSGYNDWTDTVSVTSDEYATVYAYLEQNIGSIGVWSAPLDSNIYLDGTYFGQTGTDWVWLDDVSVGTHTIKITKSGYDDWTDTVSVTSGVYSTVDAYLEQNTGSISVYSSPSGAEIYLDGTYKGTVPLTLNSVSTGSHTVKLTKSGYDDWTETVFVISGVYSTVDAYLEQNTGSIKVSSNPSDAKIYLDGTSKGTTPRTLYNVPIGSHTVKLTKSGYTDISNTVTVSSSQTASVSKTLTVQTGSISVSSNPSGAKIYLDEKYMGTSPKTLSNVPIGTHTIKLTKSGYSDISKTVTVTSGGTAQISKSLSTNPILAIGGIFLFLLLIIGIILKKSKKSADSTTTSTLLKRTFRR